MGKKPAKQINKPHEESGGLPARRGDRNLAGPVKIMPATLIDQGAEVSSLEGLPEEYKGGETMSGFPPSPEWQAPGEAVFGHFVGVRVEVGPNKSRLYEVACPQGDGKDPMTVAVWGTAAIDRLFDSAYPPIQLGDRVAFIFLGEKPTQRGLNPVKLFALRIVRAKSGAGETMRAS